MDIEIENIQKNINEILLKSFYRKLKRYEKSALKSLRIKYKNLIKEARKRLEEEERKRIEEEERKLKEEEEATRNNNGKGFENIKKMYGDFYKELKNENIQFERKIEEIKKEKEEIIQKIENEKNIKMKENKEKYKNLISYLEKIKNDKHKLTEFFEKFISF